MKETQITQTTEKDGDLLNAFKDDSTNSDSVEQRFFIVEKSVLPDVFLKVMEVKKLLDTKKEKTVQEAVSKVGISRSAFYKYRDTVYPFYENSRGKTVTIGMNLEDNSGILSNLLNLIAFHGANILTINQMIPINCVAYVTITIETNLMKKDLSELITDLENLEGVESLKIIARE